MLARRVLFLFLAVFLLIMVPVVLIWIGDATGVTHFSDIYGPWVFWNELSGPSFVILFFSVIGLTAAIMYLVMVALDTTEGGW